MVFCLLSSAYLYYTYATTTDKWRPGKLYNSIFPQNQPTVLDDINAPLVDGIDKARILREAGGLSAKDWIFPNPFKPFLQEDGTNQLNEEQVDQRTSEENFMYSNDNVPKSASNKKHRQKAVNRTSGHNGDSRAPVTATIDATTIHCLNATVKPTLAPEVEGYEKVESGERLRLRCRQCAVVSSSGHLLNKTVGEEIDRAQCVICMNSAQTGGFEEDVGRKTTRQHEIFNN